MCDADERVATPLRPLPFGGAVALAVAVSRLAEELEIGGVVVGVPVTRHGQGRGEARVAAVVEALRGTLSVPVVTVDESGTTKEAEYLLVEAGVPRRRWVHVVDGLAAKLILEMHLGARGRS